MLLVPRSRSLREIIGGGSIGGVQPPTLAPLRDVQSFALRVVRMLLHCLTLASMSVIYSRTTPGNRISLIAGDYVWAEVTDLRVGARIARRLRDRLSSSLGLARPTGLENSWTDSRDDARPVGYPRSFRRSSGSHAIQVPRKPSPQVSQGQISGDELVSVRAENTKKRA
jgi:hypothetical protein